MRVPLKAKGGDAQTALVERLGKQGDALLHRCHAHHGIPSFAPPDQLVRHSEGARHRHHHLSERTLDVHVPAEQEISFSHCDTSTHICLRRAVCALPEIFIFPPRNVCGKMRKRAHGRAPFCTNFCDTYLKKQCGRAFRAAAILKIFFSCGDDHVHFPPAERPPPLCRKGRVRRRNSTRRLPLPSPRNANLPAFRCGAP